MKILIKKLLGSVAMFMIYTNIGALVGRSVPEEKIKMYNETLEGDIMVRNIMDVKAIDMGTGNVRYGFFMSNHCRIDSARNLLNFIWR